MKIFVLNCGSSSIKYQLFDMTDETVIAKGLAEKIGNPEGHIELKITNPKNKIEVNLPLADHSVALNKIMDMMTENGVIKDKSEITAIAHRLVHAGEYYHGSVEVTDDVVFRIQECNDLAPLHIPANIIGIRTCQKLFPDTFMS